MKLIFQVDQEISIPVCILSDAPCTLGLLTAARPSPSPYCTPARLLVPLLDHIEALLARRVALLPHARHARPLLQ